MAAFSEDFLRADDFEAILSIFCSYDLRPVTLLKKETLAQMFSCEFCEIFKNTFFTEHLWTTAFGANISEAFEKIATDEKDY